MKLIHLSLLQVSMLAVGVASNYNSTKTESIERHASITSLAKTTAGISDTDEANITISTPESHIIQVRSEYTSKSDGHIGSGDIELNDIEYTDFDDKDNGLVEHKFDFKGKMEEEAKGGKVVLALVLVICTSLVVCLQEWLSCSHRYLMDLHWLRCFEEGGEE